MTQRRRITPSGWLAIALATYIVLFGLAYEFFRNRTADPAAGINSTVTTNDAVATSTNVTSPTVAEASINSATAINAQELSVSSSLTSGATILPATNLADGSFRANISFPLNNSVIEDADGWVQLQGRINQVNEGERFFLVLESPSSSPPVIYPQQELTLSPAGEWTALARFGSPGQSYRTYVISTDDATAVNALFSHEALAGLPNGFMIISNVNVNSVSMN